MATPPWKGDPSLHGGRFQGKRQAYVLLLGSLDRLLADYPTSPFLALAAEDRRGWDSALVRDFGVREIPFTVVIGRDGAAHAIGDRGKGLERAVEEALRRPAAGS